MIIISYDKSGYIRKLEEKGLLTEITFLMGESIVITIPSPRAHKALNKVSIMFTNFEVLVVSL